MTGEYPARPVFLEVVGLPEVDPVRAARPWHRKTTQILPRRTTLEYEEFAATLAGDDQSRRASRKRRAGHALQVRGKAASPNRNDHFPWPGGIGRRVETP